MKRKLLSALLVFAMMLSIIPMLTASAASTFSEAWAVNVIASGKKTNGTINDTAGNMRQIPEHSLGAPDAWAYGNVSGSENNYITSTRYYETLTYYFDGKISKNPDTYDLCLSEATVGSWHPEALEVILNGVNGGDSSISIGVAYNNMGITMMNAGAFAGFETKYTKLSQTGVVSGNYAMTYIEFPNGIDSVESVTLKDVTAEVNLLLSESGLYPAKSATSGAALNYKFGSYTYKPTTYHLKVDGFDLDAIGGWAKEEFGSIKVSVAATLTVTKNGVITRYDNVNTYRQNDPFCFILSDANGYYNTFSVNNGNASTFTNLVPGDYTLECNDVELSTYLDFPKIITVTADKESNCEITLDILIDATDRITQ